MTDIPKPAFAVNDNDFFMDQNLFRHFLIAFFTYWFQNSLPSSPKEDSDSKPANNRAGDKAANKSFGLIEAMCSTRDSRQIRKVTSQITAAGSIGDFIHLDLLGRACRVAKHQTPPGPSFLWNRNLANPFAHHKILIFLLPPFANPLGNISFLFPSQNKQDIFEYLGSPGPFWLPTVHNL